MRRIVQQLLLIALLLPLVALAGAQKYEPLSASVQAALSGAIADQAPPRSSFANPLEAADWLTEMSRRLERRIAEATRNIATLYDVTRATSSSLELDTVLKLVVEKIMAALDLQRLVLLWHPPDLERAVDAYTTAGGADGVS